MNDGDPIYTLDGLVGFYDSRARKRKRVHLPIAGSHERPDLCTPCGGKCCETFPGVPHPNDLGAPDEDLLRATVRALLATGRWCVASDGRTGWGPDAEPAFFYLRPEIKEDESKTHFGLGGRGEKYGPCTFHGPGGCEIYETRPRGCRELVPDEDAAKCKSRQPREALFDAWEPYEWILLSET
jgi:Fe-S-cluster containining protein